MSIAYRTVGLFTYHSGWMGLRSFPMISDDGFSLLAISTSCSGLRHFNISSLCKVNCPYTSTSSQIKYPLGIGTDWSKVKLSFENQAVYMMSHIHTLLLIFIVGLSKKLLHRMVDLGSYFPYHGIGSFSECMIATSILQLISDRFISRSESTTHLKSTTSH